jgi:methylmalonyl-CoA mutase C-terminal domain/subunit
MGSRPIRVVVAKAGLDGHDRGAKVVARTLRDAGCEVIYTGLHQTPEEIVTTAIQEDADAIGLSILSGAHLTLFKKIIDLIGSRKILLFGGGVIPDDDVRALEALGVAKIFTSGASTNEIAEWVKASVSHR